MTVTPTSGIEPLDVHFSSAGTYDPDPGDALSFEWDFTNDGTVDATSPETDHTYVDQGSYTARLSVTDQAGNSAIATVSITVGNTRPSITITAPVEGGIYDWGELWCATSRS